MFTDYFEKRIKKAGDPNAKSPFDTKKEKKSKDEKKHKKPKKTNQVELFDECINSALLERLKALADITEDDIKFTNNGFSFDFGRSPRANFCRVQEHNGSVIMELRKKTEGILEGTKNQLVFERSIKPQEFNDLFEYQTGIYLSY